MHTIHLSSWLSSQSTIATKLSLLRFYSPLRFAKWELCTDYTCPTTYTYPSGPLTFGYEAMKVECHHAHPLTLATRLATLLPLPTGPGCRLPLVPSAHAAHLCNSSTVKIVIMHNVI